ncbi:MAG: hypothetical protein KKF56_03070 [Nanoarchaeota archaeon]|nr:hypothetical protein [Nanoarchaeota archaeon]
MGIIDPTRTNTIPLVTPLPINYITHPQDRLPAIGIFYQFPSRWTVLCQEFKLDFDRLKQGRKVILSGETLDFRNKKRLLDYLDRHDYQAVQTKVPDGISFSDTAEVVSSTHFNDFFSRYSWVDKLISN